jgi:hypothetical protein
VWAQAAGERPGRKQTFTSALVEHGVELEPYQHAKFAKGFREISRGLAPTFPETHPCRESTGETSQHLPPRLEPTEDGS